MKKNKVFLFLVALFTFSLVIPLTSCGPTHEAKAEWVNDATNHWHECVVEDCDEKFDLAAHAYGEWKIVTQPTCETKGQKERSCSVCGYKDIVDIPALGHDKETTWSNDETSHWHNCTKCGEKLDKASHTYGEYKVSKEPTCTEKGLKYKTCTVCGYKVEEEIPALGHDVDTSWSKDETHHWHDCSRCDEKHDKAPHTFGEYVVESQPTCTEKGSKYKTCSVCGYKIVEEIPALGHDFAKTWSSDDTHHWKGCSRCDEKHEYAPHTYGEWQTITDPTCTTAGSKKRVCTVCQHEEIAEIPALGHDVSTTWSHDENQHWHNCSRCSEKHDLADHTFGEWVIDSEGTCNYPGEKHRICTVCGYKEVVQEITAPHLYSSLAITKNPTTAETGTLTITCAYGHTETVTLPKVSETDYQYHITQIDAETANVEYSIKQATATSLLAGTMAENVEAANTALIAIKFGKHVENIACPHSVDDISYTISKRPTYENVGEVIYECANCHKTLTKQLPRISLDNYDLTKIEDDAGEPRLTYKIASTLASQIEQAAVEAFGDLTTMTRMNFRGETYVMNRWYNIDIISGLITDDLSKEIQYTVDAENCAQSLVYTKITGSQTDKFTYEIVDGSDCHEPVIKYGKLKLAEAQLLETRYSDHPQFAQKIADIRVIKVTPTQKEIDANISDANKHKIGTATIIQAPTPDVPGKMLVKCDNYDKCGYSYEYILNKLDISSYDKTYSKGVNRYVAKSSYINTVVSALQLKFASAPHEIIPEISTLLVFEEKLKAKIWIHRYAEQPDEAFTVKMEYPGAPNNDEIVSPFTYGSNPEYFRDGYYYTSGCDHCNYCLYITEQAANIICNKVVYGNKNDLFNFFMHNTVAIIRTTGKECADNKTEDHNFVIDNVVGTTTQDNQVNAYVTWHCAKCSTSYRIDYSYDQIFVMGDTNQMVADVNLLLDLIKAKYPEFTTGEISAIEAMLWDVITQL